MLFPLIDYDGARRCFSPSRFNKAVDDFNSQGRVLYGTLRSLCQEHPGHGDLSAVTAKVWIIGRSYSTQIERHVRSTGQQGSAISQVAGHLFKHRKILDALISDIRDEPPHTMDDSDISAYVRAHGKFANLLSKITYNKKLSLRSFTSKYLHFHRPIVPIYDSVAAATLSKLLPWKKAYDCGVLDEAEDAYYRQYVMHLRQLDGAAKKAGFAPLVMELDWFLMCEAYRVFPAKS